MGRQQIERIQKNAASPRWGWSGVREIVPPVWSEAELRRVAGLLPSYQTSIENIVGELHAIRGRYHRNLHQDEFGPTRAERMQALRDLLVRLGVLSSRLEALPPQLQLLLSEGFLECRSAAGQLDFDPVAFYSADKTAIDVVSETASDIRHTLASVGRTDEANLIREVCAAADTIVPLLWNLDTTTDGDVVIDAGSAGPEPADNSAGSFRAVCAPVRRLRSRFELALANLRRRKGPEARLSLAWWSRNFAISGDERPVNDYSACSTWLVHKNDAYLVHVYRGRLEYPDLRRKVIGLAAEHRATTVLIEDAGPGMNLLQDLRSTMPGGMTRPIGVKPEGSKVDRMAAQSAKIEA